MIISIAASASRPSSATTCQCNMRCFLKWSHSRLCSWSISNDHEPSLNNHHWPLWSVAEPSSSIIMSSDHHAYHRPGIHTIKMVTNNQHNKPYQLSLWWLNSFGCHPIRMFIGKPSCTIHTIHEISPRIHHEFAFFRRPAPAESWRPCKSPPSTRCGGAAGSQAEALAPWWSWWLLVKLCWLCWLLRGEFGEFDA